MHEKKNVSPYAYIRDLVYKNKSRLALLNAYAVYVFSYRHMYAKVRTFQTQYCNWQLQYYYKAFYCTWS